MQGFKNGDRAVLLDPGEYAPQVSYSMDNQEWLEENVGKEVTIDGFGTFCCGVPYARIKERGCLRIPVAALKKV